MSFRDVPFPDIITGDLHGADVALAQVTITDEREHRVKFSVTYFDSAPAVLAPSDAGDIHELATARDRSWVVERDTTEQSFVAASRLQDIADILSGLVLTYDQVEPQIAAENPQQAEQTRRELRGLLAYVEDLRDREIGGRK